MIFMRKIGVFFLVIVTVIVSALTSSAVTYYIMSSDKDSATVKNEIVTDGKTKEQNIYQAVAEKATPSVVGVTTTTIDRNSIFDFATESKSVGTGIIVDSKGFILTNSHVIQDGRFKSVNVLFNDGTTSPAEVLWFDPTLDLAVIKTNKTGLTPAELGDSDKVRVGDIAIAIGNPLGLDLQKTVTQGIISGLDRTITTENNKMTGLFQTDASINGGNSGGPLLDQNGNVIGINTAKAQTGEGIGFAIPINTAKKIVQTVITSGGYEKVLLGVKAIDLKFYEASTGKHINGADRGIIVKEVIPGSSADKADVKPDDVIIKVDKTNIDGMTDLQKVLYNYSAGSKATLSVIRNGKEVKLHVTFQKDQQQ